MLVAVVLAVLTTVVVVLCANVEWVMKIFWMRLVISKTYEVVVVVDFGVAYEWKNC